MGEAIMKRKLISLILCLCMIFSLFGGFQNAFASEEKGEYIVYLDVEKQSPGYEEAYLNKDYGKAISLADEALDYYEGEFKSMFAGIEVISRAQLLVPSLCVRLNKSDLDAIKALDYVKEVFNNEIIYESDVVRSDMRVFKDQSVMTDSIKMVNSNELIGNDDVLQKKYNGAGSVLAIIDSNMDPSHNAFYLTHGGLARLRKPDINDFLNGGKLSLKDNTQDQKLYEDVYRSEKIPFGWNYNTNSKDLNPEKEKAAHGQHVSGTVAGNAVQIDGKTWRGVAPEAQLLMMNVMKQGSTSSNIYIRAMQDAIVMGADAVNMSLGSTKGLPGQADGLVGKAINNGYAADTNFVIAAGNEGDYQGELNIDNPDFGTMAAPGIATNAITVASLENKSMYVPLITYNGNKYIFQTGGEIRFKKGDYYLVDCGNGVIKAEDNIDDFKGKDLEGKVALIKRGGNTFSEKVLNAEKAGAVGAIIYNNVEGDLYMSVSGNKIPAISVTLDTAETLLKDLSKPVSIDMTPQEADNPQYGELSEFTNWGLSAGGYMKPDITAPGGHIYSTQTGGNTFGDMSGTSMATPHVTGAVGVIRARLNEMLFAGEEHKAALTKTILMNSAIPHVDPKTGQTTSPRRQGAGVMNLTKASMLDFTVVDRDTKIASKFVGNVDDKITLNLTIHNYSGTQKVLTPSVQATIEARDGKKLLLRPDELFSNTYKDKIVTVPAHTSVEYDITFPIEHLEKVEAFTNGAFVEGFLHLRDENGMEISFPFVSFKGSYDNIPSIEKPLYEFDFESEKPMYWNLKTRNHDWFKYSTHIETNYGTYKDDKGRTFNNVIIAGLKNFDDIDEKKNTADEPKPEFTPIVLSPNADNYQDVLSIQMVMTRTANVKASIIDKEGKSEDFNIGLKYTNISTDPDNDKNRDTYLGYTAPGAVPLKDYEDGDYTLRLTAAAIKAPKESYPETFRDIKFTIDTVAPQFENSFYDEKTRELTFDIKEEGSGLDEFDIKDENGKAMDFTREGNKVKLVVPEGKELSDINITAMDFGHNINEVTAEMLVFKDMFGSLEIEVKQAGTEALNLEYKVYTEDGKELKNHEHLKFGKYKLVVTNYSNKFELKGESEIPFEISQDNKNYKITLEFTEIPTGRITIKVASKDNLEWTDFDLLAKNVKNNKVFKFIQDEGIYDKYFDADLPYGDYNFYAEFKNGKEGYTITFGDDMPFTVNSSTNYSTVTANIKRSGFYKVHITTEGAEGVKYLARDSKNGSIVGLDELAEGTWMIFPEKMPEGMFMEKPYEYVTLTQEKPEANVTFTYEEIGDKKFTFTIKDNYEDAEYYLCDFYAWIGDYDNGKELEYTPGMELEPGTYYVEAEANRERFGETTLTIDKESYEQTSRTFKSTTDPVEVEFKWTKYSDTDKTSEGAIFVNDDNLPADLKKNSYEYVLTGTKGEPIKKTFIKTGFSTWFVNLPYDYYQVEVKGLPEGYTVNTKEFVVNSNEYQVEFVIELEKKEETVSVDFKFTKDGEALDNVKFKLDDKEFTSGTIEIAPGEYDVEIIEPEGLVPTEEFKTITIDENTKSLTIELKEGKAEPVGEGTITVKIYEVNGANERETTSFAYVDSKFAMGGETVKVPYGEHTVKLASTWNRLGKYDEEKSVSSKTVKIDENNQNVEVKLTMVVKGSTPTPEPDPEPEPNPDGKGTIKVEVYEFSDAGAKLEKFASYDIDNKSSYESKPIEVDFGTHVIELYKYTWNMYGKYDPDKSIIKKTVTVDANNPNVTVKLYKVLKGTKANPPKDDETTPTPGPDPKPEVPTKGKASWDINYTGSRTGLNFFEQVKLYKVVDGKDEEVKLSFDQEYKKAEKELEFGKYAYVLKDISDYLKVNVKNKRIEFTLDAKNPSFKAVFEIEDKKEVQIVEVRIPKDANESLDDYTIRVFDMKGNEVDGVTKTAKGFEFPAISGVDYELRLDGTKYAYYPNIINAYPSQTFSKYINIVAPLILKVNSLAGDAPVEAKYAVSAKTNYGVTYVTDLKKVPYIGNGNQLYQVKFLGCEQGYKLDDDEIKEFTVREYSRQELTFKFKRDEDVAIVNKEELKALVSEYDNIKKTDAYKNADANKRKAYDDAIGEAKLELAKAVTSQDAIDALVKKVKDARDAIIGSMENLKKQELKKLLDDEINVKAKDIYKFDTAEDQKAYDDAITKGNEVYEDVNATEEAIDKAIADIKAALNKLDGFDEADKTELKKLLDDYNKVSKSDEYWNSTEKEREAYQTAIIEGTNIYNKKEATQEEVKAAIKAIEDAIKGLSGYATPTEKTEPVKLDDAYVNDKYIRGTGIKGAYVYYKIVKKGQNADDAAIRNGMLINEKDGKFSISIGQIQDGDKVIVYQQEVNKLMSDGVIVNILPLDKSELLELIAKAEEIKDTDQYKYAPEDRQKDLDKELANAIKVKDDENSSMEDIEKTIINIKSAIASIENYEIIRHEVTFYPNNETDPWTVKIIDGENVNRPDDPVRKGYIFKGWFTDEEFTEEFDFAKPIVANTNIYAKWEEILEYEITFDPANGEATWTEKVREGEKVKEPAKPTKANHTFIAWQFNGQDYDFNTSVMANMMLIAKWEENKVDPQPQPNPQPDPYEPYEPYELYRPEPKPYRPSKPSEPSKPINNNEDKKDEKPVETKKDYGLKDVPAGTEGEAVRNLVSYGIIKGMGNGMFQGNKTITRAMVTRVFMLISKDKAIDKDVYFSDVTNDKWYAESVKWAASKGIIAGYTDGTFKPEKKVTRQEFCVMLNNLLKANGIELETVVPVDEAEFAKADDWAKDAMIAMKRAGLVNVEANGKFGPQSKFTREEFA